MPTGRNGIKRILQGIYQAQNNVCLVGNKRTGIPVPRHVIVNCADPRVDPSRYAELDTGEMFLIRNAGNLIPHPNRVTNVAAATEPAVLELAFTKFFTVKQVAVCGHSNCKAMAFLHSMKDDPNIFTVDTASELKLCNNPLRTWIVNHGTRSLAHFLNLEYTQFSVPLVVNAELPDIKLEAWIDPENQYAPEDKLAIINSLVQLENAGSYEFMKPSLESGKVLLHALWYDVHTKVTMVFSRNEKRFIPLYDPSTIDVLVQEAKDTVSKVKAKVAIDKETLEKSLKSVEMENAQCSHKN